MVEVGAIMTETGERHLPVGDHHTVIGIVSARDVLTILVASARNGFEPVVGPRPALRPDRVSRRLPCRCDTRNPLASYETERTVIPRRCFGSRPWPLWLREPGLCRRDDVVKDGAAPVGPGIR
jgi:CBS domain-containing protein